MSPWPVTQAKYEAHRAQGVGKAGDLVVDQSSGEPGCDDVGVLDRRAYALDANDPDRTVRLDPLLDVLQPLQVRRVTRAHEYEIYGCARPATDDVGRPLLEERDEVLVVEVDDGDLRTRLDAELAGQRPRPRNG